MTNAEMKKALIAVSVFSFISITMMLQRAATKHIVIADAAGTTIDREVESKTTLDSYNLRVDRNVGKGQEGKLIIPLSKSVGSDDIVLEDHYLDHELLIYIDGREEGFYLNNPIKTDLDLIESAVCETENDSGAVCLDFKLDGLYANESSLTESGTIEVRFFKPYDEYDKIVVVDPSCGGTDMGCVYGGLTEKGVALDVALELNAIAEKSEGNDIKFYYTRLSDKNVDDNSRQTLIDETKADMLIGISARLSETSEENGVETTYNELYFRRDLSNAQFADIMEKNCVSKSGADALGMGPSSDEDVLIMESTIPSCRVIAGILDGEKDNRMLQDKNYKSKLAAGIYQGIVEAFEELGDK
ncbi:MAG: N-acetylmuramoyl-L-alanine amidase [Butyrivibrio sp.]|nr:N-acetylmuramoyl-L-alanine amidase [Butyrivibrio sp.]